MKSDQENMGEFASELSALIKQWRLDAGWTLHQARAETGLSIGYISDLENGKVEFSDMVFLRYHKLDPDIFSIKLWSAFSFMGVDADSGASKKKPAKNKRKKTMDPQAQDGAAEKAADTENETDASDAPASEQNNDEDQKDTSGAEESSDRDDGPTSGQGAGAPESGQNPPANEENS